MVTRTLQPDFLYPTDFIEIDWLPLQLIICLNLLYSRQLINSGHFNFLTISHSGEVFEYFLSAKLKKQQHLIIPPANCVCGRVYCFHFVRPTDRVSVMFCFLNNFKNH